MGVRVRQKSKGKGAWWVFISHNVKRTSRKLGDKQAAEELASTIPTRIQLGGLVLKIKSPCQLLRNIQRCGFHCLMIGKESTRENYLNNLDKHISPALGSIPVNEIKRKDLKFFFDKKYAEGLNPKTLN